MDDPWLLQIASSHSTLDHGVVGEVGEDGEVREIEELEKSGKSGKSKKFCYNAIKLDQLKCHDQNQVEYDIVPHSRSDR